MSASERRNRNKLADEEDASQLKLGPGEARPTMSTLSSEDCLLSELPSVVQSLIRGW